MNEPLPSDVPSCHQLIGLLREELAAVRRQLAVHEQNQQREFERMYGKSVTAQSLLNFGLLVAGKGGVVRSKNPNDPTCGELYAQACAAEREQRRQQRERRRKNASAGEGSRGKS